MPHCNTVALPVSIATYLMWKGLMVKSKLTFAIFSRRVHWWIIASESLCTVLTQLWLFRCLCPVCGWVKSFPKNCGSANLGKIIGTNYMVKILLWTYIYGKKIWHLLPGCLSCWTACQCLPTASVSVLACPWTEHWLQSPINCTQKHIRGKKTHVFLKIIS